MVTPMSTGGRVAEGEAVARSSAKPLRRHCPTCGQDIAAEFDAYNMGVRRARHAYATDPFGGSIAEVIDAVKTRGFKKSNLPRDVAAQMRAEARSWANDGAA